MHDVGTSWNGPSEVHEVTMEDNYEFSLEESRGVPPSGEAGLQLPPHTANTGLQPEGPDPYQDTRDASYISGNAERRHCKMGDVDSEWADAFLPSNDHLYSQWSLGESDMQSLFVEMHENDYLEALDFTMSNLAAEGEQPFIAEWQVQETVQSKRGNLSVGPANTFPRCKWKRTGKNMS